MMDEIKREIAEAMERSYNDGYEDGLRDAKAKCLKSLAPVRHGHWIYRKADSGFHTDCVCSECKSKHAIGWNYCPNCGARMDGEQDG